MLRRAYSHPYATAQQPGGKRTSIYDLRLTIDEMFLTTHDSRLTTHD